jgi:hypothetical protein
MLFRIYNHFTLFYIKWYSIFDVVKQIFMRKYTFEELFYSYNTF